MRHQDSNMHVYNLYVFIDPSVCRRADLITKVVVHCSCGYRCGKTQNSEFGIPKAEFASVICDLEMITSRCNYIFECGPAHMNSLQSMYIHVYILGQRIIGIEPAKHIF